MGDSEHLMLDRRTLQQIMPRVPDAAFWSALLNSCISYCDAGTVPRAAALLAQLAHESGECRFMRELGNGERYEGRKNLGNTEKGDGPRYKGRGLIQITGRSNYRRAGRHIGLNLELHPEDAEKASVAVQVVSWYWELHGLNELADVYDFVGITRRINGGTNGLAHRIKYYLRALEALARRKRDG